MLLTAAARRTSARRTGLNSAGALLTLKVQKVAVLRTFSYLKVYGNSYPEFQVIVRDKIYLVQ
jgi:hypothetical protein